MDKSVDSIGSCSLDVDAVSDFSDTSGSLNFPTPISIKDITKEFTANIHERCTVRKVHMQTISNQAAGCPVTSPSASLLPTTVDNEKKPSYLNLACCVNGYSNLTTYDSKIRQDINKSREVSPIRPSSNSIQYCKKSDCLAPPPALETMSHGSINGSSNIKETCATKTTITSTSKLATYCQENGHQMVIVDEGGSQRSFIQQRVERLYGPGALAQGYISQKKVRDSNVRINNNPDQNRDNNIEISELTMKFKQLSPSKDYGEFRRKINGTESQTLRGAMENNNVDNNSIDLPVLRHLSQEFRAQLPKISPKRNVMRSPPMEKAFPDALKNTKDTHIKKLEERIDEVDHKNVTPHASISNTDINVTLNPELVHKSSVEKGAHHIEMTPSSISVAVDEPSSSSHLPPTETQSLEKMEKNGHYFLKLLKKEQDRLLSLACVAEKYIELLTVQPDTSEEVFGLLRSAAGKARLLVSQKLKQFEGLCHKNLKETPGEKFPTTADDLQGFWDMVNLQIDHIDSIFADIENLKRDNWKKQEEIAPLAIPKKQKPSNRTLIPKPNSVSNGNSPKSQAAMSASALKRESQRKQLMEMKRKNKMAMAATASAGPEAAAAESGDFIGNLPATLAETGSIEICINENQS